MAEQKDVFDANRVYPNTLLFIENSMLAFLQSYFSLFPRGQTPRWYHYDSLPELTEIEIEGQSTDNLVNADVRPKITVARGPLGWANTHINNFVGSKNLSVERQKFASIDKGSVSISCFSKNDLEADAIAYTCYSAVRGYGTVLQRLGYLSIKAAQVGQRGMIKSSSVPELFVTPVLVQVEVSSQWTLNRLDPIKLREVLVQYVTKP